MRRLERDPREIQAQVVAGRRAFEGPESIDEIS
jgi:hypothetical protein